MFDRLLGRGGDDEEKQELRRKLEKTETRLEAAEAQRDKAEKRRQEAASEKQEAQRRVNVLEDRVTGLESELERLREGAGDEAEGFSRVVTVEMEHLLHRLGSYAARSDDLVTLISPDLSGEDVLDDLDGDLAAAKRFERDGVLYHDEAGVLSCVVKPPTLRADPAVRYGDRFDTDPVDLTELRRNHVLCFVRSDESAVARFRDGDLEEFRHLSADVKSKHTKGGFSQKRFERLREEQVKKHVEDTERAARDLLNDYGFVALGGDSGIATRVAGELDLPERRYAVKPLSHHDVEEEDDLRDVEHEYWSHRVYVL